MGQALKFLVVDDHHLVREGLKLALRQLAEGETEFLEADNVRDGIAAYRACSDIDLVLLDLNMAGTAGVAALDAFETECPDARIVVVSASYDMQTVQSAVRRGVLGFIPKLAGKDALLGALRFIMEGGIYVPPEALVGGPLRPASASTPSPSPSRARQPGSPMDAGLTARQMEVLGELLEGKSNKQICIDMNLAMGTVKAHIAAIFGALGVRSRAEAIAASDKLGWRTWLGDHPAPQAAGRER